MKPSRAAWLFAAGIGWLVLRGLLIHSQPWLRTEYAVQHGGIVLVVPLLSLIASITVPLFFLSLLRHARLDGQPWLRLMTVASLAASSLATGLVIVTFVETLLGTEPQSGVVATSAPWLVQAAAAVFLAALMGFLIAFAIEHRGAAQLRRAAGIAAVGSLVPITMVTGWILHTRVDDMLVWFPGFSQSIVAKMLGLIGAGTLVWFLEAFASGHDESRIE